MDLWHKIALPRPEVREGRSFDPDEFAIALEQVVFDPKRAPEDYANPEKFFARTYFTRALIEHTGTVLRRLSGQTANAAPVLTFITQFGGGKTHTLTTLYHLASNGPKASAFPGVRELLVEIGLPEVPLARVGVFVGNAWDPREGRETPWIDLARQVAGEAGVKSLGPSAATVPPGTESLARVFAAAGRPVLLLLDEVLNFVNRHRAMADGLYAFVQNLTVAATGAPNVSAVLSLPKSTVEMTNWDAEWQARISKVVHRVAKDLIVNEESEVSEVVRRRLFEDLGDEKIRRKIAKAYADWCFERRAQLPAQWTAADAATTEGKARDTLYRRFEASYPFHPATLSVFQRKWQTLPLFQQTRGTLAMFAQWLSKAYVAQHRMAWREPLITLGSAPLDDRDFRATILGVLGEPKLNAAIEADIAGPMSHAAALDVDSKGSLRSIHTRVATAILFESSGGQTDKFAHLPELRFAVGGPPDIETTTIDITADALERKAYFIRKVGTDGFRIGPRAKLNKVMADRRASLDDDTDVKPTVRSLVKEHFEKGATLPMISFPDDGAAIPDTPRLALVVMDPIVAWEPAGPVAKRIEEWTLRRGASDRLYPASLIWCLRKPGRELTDKVEVWLAWKWVAEELRQGLLGDDGDPEERREVHVRVKDALEGCIDEIWGSYRFVVLLDREKGRQPIMKTIDLGAGHASAGETLTGRIVTALRSQGLLDIGVGAGYLDRHWPDALVSSGAWPLSGLRQSFLDGSFTRLLDPDRVLRSKIVEFVERGDFGLASEVHKDGSYERLWFEESLPTEEVTFEADVYLLKKATAQRFKQAPLPPLLERPEEIPSSTPVVTEGAGRPAQPLTGSTHTVVLRVVGAVPPEQWNKLGLRLIPKLRTNAGNGTLKLDVNFSVSLSREIGAATRTEIAQALADLGLEKLLRIDVEDA